MSNLLKAFIKKVDNYTIAVKSDALQIILEILLHTKVLRNEQYYE